MPSYAFGQGLRRDLQILLVTYFCSFSGKVLAARCAASCAKCHHGVMRSTRVSVCLDTHHLLLLDMIWKFLRDDVGVRQQNIANGLSERNRVKKKKKFQKIGPRYRRCLQITLRSGRSPWRISSCSCQQSGGRDTPVCGWFRSSDWAVRTHPPPSRRTKRVPKWPGTARQEEKEQALNRRRSLQWTASHVIRLQVVIIGAWTG